MTVQQAVRQEYLPWMCSVGFTAQGPHRFSNPSCTLWVIFGAERIVLVQECRGLQQLPEVYDTYERHHQFEYADPGFPQQFRARLQELLDVGA